MNILVLSSIYSRGFCGIKIDTTINDVDHSKVEETIENYLISTLQEDCFDKELLERGTFHHSVDDLGIINSESYMYDVDSELLLYFIVS